MTSTRYIGASLSMTTHWSGPHSLTCCTQTQTDWRLDCVAVSVDLLVMALNIT